MDTIPVEQKFHIVDSNFPIPTDGIIGRDFLSTHKCKIDYEPWLLSFTVNQNEITIPIEDNFKRMLYLPARHEVARYLPNLNLTEDMVVFSQEIQSGIFCGNTIISAKNPTLKFINTTEQSVYIAYSKFKPKMEPIKKCSIIQPSNHTTNTTERRAKILKDIQSAETPSYIKQELEK